MGRGKVGGRASGALRLEPSNGPEHAAMEADVRRVVAHGTQAIDRFELVALPTLKCRD
jgi:hypothetical protein